MILSKNSDFKYLAKHITRNVFWLMLATVIVTAGCVQQRLPPPTLADQADSKQSNLESKLLILKDLEEAGYELSLWEETTYISNAQLSSSAIQSGESSLRHIRNSNLNMSYVAIQFDTLENANLVWENALHDPLFAVETKPISPLSVEDLPPLTADNISVHCEERITEPIVNSCVILLTYESYFVKLQTSVVEPTNSPTSIYRVLSIIDTKMEAITQ